MLSAHYRAPLNINEESIETANKECTKVLRTMRSAYIKLERASIALVGDLEHDVYQSFMDAMQDDLNTPNAFAALFEENKRLNAALRQRVINAEDVVGYVLAMEHMLTVLGIEYERITLTDEDRKLFANWEGAKEKRDFDQADIYRAQLNERGLL